MVSDEQIETAARHVAATVSAALHSRYHMNADPHEDDPLKFAVAWPDGALVEVNVVAVGLVGTTELHAAYADPIRGGWDGYQAACWDCEWRSPTVHPAGRDGKSAAQDEASMHRAESGVAGE